MGGGGLKYELTKFFDFSNRAFSTSTGFCRLAGGLLPNALMLSSLEVHRNTL